MKEGEIKPLRIYKNRDGCWIVISHKSKVGGYPVLNRLGKQIRLNRDMYEKHNGPIPEGMYVLHTCDNRGCVNPEHLFLGTHLDNIADCVRKGRQARGEKNGHAKLTEDDVRKIREMEGTCREIAEKFNISPSHVSHLKNRDWWKHIK